VKRRPPAPLKPLTVVAPTAREELLPPQVVADRLGISTKTLARLPIRRLQIGPRLVKYKWSWVEAYIEREAVA
jgi:hypothetical protein